MRLLLLYLNFILLIILVSCEEPKTTDETIDENDEKSARKIPADDDDDADDADEDENSSDTLKVIDDIGEKMPILPPIILLDFVNDLENSTASAGDEKSKRTVESNYGNGFGRNNFFTGKYNYYFPAGKTGTSVSIEESISPFLPKTIIESIKSPIRANHQQAEKIQNVYNNGNLLNNNGAISTNSAVVKNIQGSIQSKNRYENNPTIYGTKLYKPTSLQNDYKFHEFSTARPSIDLTTPKPNYRNPLADKSNANFYVTPRPTFSSSNTYSANYETSKLKQSYASTQAPSQVRQENPIFQSSTSQFTNLPRYTIENGVRYENKIVWKYPDGKISQIPPYSYNDYLTKQKPSALRNYENQQQYEIPNGNGNYQHQHGPIDGNFGGRTIYRYHTDYQPEKINYDSQQQNYGIVSNVNSKSPAQFPNNEAEDARKPSQFVSSASLANGNSLKISQDDLPANLRGHGTNIQGHSTNVQGHGTNLQSHGINLQGHGINLQGHGTNLQGHGTNLQGHGISLQGHGTNIQGHGTNFQGQGTNFQGQGTNLQGHGTNLQGHETDFHGHEANVQSHDSNFQGHGANFQGHGANFQGHEANFQGHYGEKTSIRAEEAARPLTSFDNYQTTKRPLSKYAVNSPNPEYTYTTESSTFESSMSDKNDNVLTSDGKLTEKILSKYTPEAQKYLEKVFASNDAGLSSSVKQAGVDLGVTSKFNYQEKTSNYDNLLNYNPSLTQYIRDPTSILKAQPTFIQAGNSLIPVIILRVDAAAPSPLEANVTPNVNLKALLRQYLHQYADKLGQNFNYQLDDEKSTNYPGEQQQQDPLYELTRLAQSLTQYRRNPAIVNHYAKQLEANLNKNSYDNSYRTNNNNDYGYEAINHDDKNQPTVNNNYGRKSNRQKVKNVEIIEDPRYTAYNVETS